MSHITTIALKVRDLNDLAIAGEACGLEFRRGQLKHRSYFSEGDCLHALVIPNDTTSYEIGVVRAADGDGYELKVDPYQQRRLLEMVGGIQYNKLRREYAAAVATRQARTLARQGFSVTREELPGSRIRLRLARR